MRQWEMEYNSEREDLIIPEYGRHVQNLVDYAKTILDLKERQAFVDKIVELMMQIHPQSRNIEDYKDRLWKHVFRIANYELEGVNPPSGVTIPSAEEAQKKPEKIPYPATEAKFRHYGHNIQTLVQKALSMEEGPKRDGLVAVIGSYMKLAYKTWNKEHYVSDDVIKNDLETLSAGKLSLDEDFSLDNLAAMNRRRRRPSSQPGDQQGRPSSGGNGRGRNRPPMRRRKG